MFNYAIVWIPPHICKLIVAAKHQNTYWHHWCIPLSQLTGLHTYTLPVLEGSSSLSVSMRKMVILRICSRLSMRFTRLTRESCHSMPWFPTTCRIFRGLTDLWPVPILSADPKIWSLESPMAPMSSMSTWVSSSANNRRWCRRDRASGEVASTVRGGMAEQDIPGQGDWVQWVWGGWGQTAIVGALVPTLKFYAWLLFTPTQDVNWDKWRNIVKYSVTSFHCTIVQTELQVYQIVAKPTIWQVPT